MNANPTTPYETVRQFENEAFWTDRRYTTIETERAQQTLSWLPADVHSVLDVGCGNGVLTNLLEGPDLIVGTDRSFAALGFVRKPRCLSDIVCLPFVDGAFDAVLSTEVIEHMPGAVYPAALSELARVARRYVLVTVPYQERLWMREVRCPHCGASFHEHGHQRSYNAALMRELFAKVPGMHFVRAQAIFPRQRYLFAAEGLVLFRRMTSPAERFPGRSVCPQCGYTRAEQRAATTSASASPAAPRAGSTLQRRVKKIWPRYVSYSWWLGLYEKENQSTT